MAKWEKVFGGIIGGALLGAGVMHIFDKTQKDKLQDQVITLQDKNIKLEKLLAERETVVEKLSLKLKLTAMESAISANSNAQMRIILMYALKDYSEIYVKRINDQDIFENDFIFFKAMDDFIEGRNVPDNNIALIVNRVLLRYAHQVEGGIEPNFGEITRYLADIKKT